MALCLDGADSDDIILREGQNASEHASHARHVIVAETLREHDALARFRWQVQPLLVDGVMMVYFLPLRLVCVGLRQSLHQTLGGTQINNM